MLKARCPSCGKSASLNESDAGLAIVCLACGARYTAPELLPTSGRNDSGTAGGDGAAAVVPSVGRTFWVAVGLGALAAIAALSLTLRGPGEMDKRTDAEALAILHPPSPYSQPATSTAPALAAAVPATPPHSLNATQPAEVASNLLEAATTPAVTRPAVQGAAVEPPAASRPLSPSPAVGAVPPASSPSTPSTRPTTAAVAGPRPPIRPMPAAPDGITDEQIGRAIQKGVDHLLSRFDNVRHTLDGVDIGAADGGGQNALAVYALMQAGQAIHDERLNVRGDYMNKVIEAMKDSRLRRGHAQTYATGIRATALALFNRPQDRAVLRQDVAGLLLSHTQGAYSYAIDPNRSKHKYKQSWDNSNSQYGLLGVWAGAEAAVEVPQGYWAAVEQHWIDQQLPDGQWSYAGERGGRITMTSAGIASLFVTHDWLDAPKFGRVVGREPFSPALQRGLDWFETADHSISLNSSYWGYTLYGIERVGLASGFKYFGTHDWYRHLAADTVARQADDGAWGDTVDTSFALLFLSRGRHPILMNKVRFSGYWANRPRDVANLARFAARQLERELNWQVVPLRPPRQWVDWLDSPILYLASHQAPRLLKEDYDNLRNFVDAGGLLFTQSDGDDPQFNKWAYDLAITLFPKYEMRDLPADHAVYNLVYKIEGEDRPALRAVSNGSRLLMIHSPSDIARAWQLRETRGRKGVFHFGVNLFLYAAGKRDLRNRLDSTFVSDPGEAPNGKLALARLQHAGNWDPEPAAWPRFSRWLQRQTGTGLNLPVSKLSQLRPGLVGIAHLTGTARHDFSAEEVAAAKAFVEAGGVLFIDQCGGTGEFHQSVLDTLLSKAFPNSTLAPLEPAEHPLFRGGWETSGMDDLTKPRLRQFTVPGRVNEAAPILGFAAGKGHVIFTPIDVTSGLLGTRTWGIAGLHPDYASAFVKNLIFWTMDGQADK